MYITKRFVKRTEKGNALILILFSFIAIIVLGIGISLKENSKIDNYKNDQWKMENINNVVRLQMGILSESEEDISMNSLFEERMVFLDKNNPVEEKIVFITPLGFLDKKIASNNDYFVLNFHHDPAVSQEVGKKVCLDYLNFLKDNDELIGFNENSQNIIKLESIVKDDNWLNLMCDNFFNKNKNNTLNIGVKTNVLKK